MTRIAKNHTRSMAEFLTRTQKALADAAQAVNDTATEGEPRDRLLAVGSFALDHGLAEAINLLPPHRLTPADFEKLPVFSSDRIGGVI